MYLYIIQYNSYIYFSMTRIKFSVVSEPDDPDEDCEDVGVAYADLKEILDRDRNMENEDIPSKVIGCMAGGGGGGGTGKMAKQKSGNLKIIFNIRANTGNLKISAHGQ